MSGHAKRFSAPPFRRCRSYCPGLERAVAVSTPRPHARFPRIVSRVRARVRSCKSQRIRASAPPYEIGMASRLYCYRDRTYTHSREQTIHYIRRIK